MTKRPGIMKQMMERQERIQVLLKESREMDQKKWTIRTHMLILIKMNQEDVRTLLAMEPEPTESVASSP